jgi:hypothetical protein
VLHHEMRWPDGAARTAIDGYYLVPTGAVFAGKTIPGAGCDRTRLAIVVSGSVLRDDAQALSIRRGRSRRAYLQVQRRHDARPPIRGRQSVAQPVNATKRAEDLGWGEALLANASELRRQPWRLPADPRDIAEWASNEWFLLRTAGYDPA